MISSRAMLFMLNGLFFLMGCAIMSVGFWAQYDSNFSTLWSSLEVSKLMDARTLNGASLLLIISGLSSIIVSFIGLYGALNKDKCFLTTYTLLMSVIFMLELAAAVVFLSYENQSYDKLREGLNDTVAKINEDNDKVSINVMNTVQTIFKCCGCEGPNDYKNLTMMHSCETTKSTPLVPDYYQDGCYQSIVHYIKSHMPILFGVSISIILLQVIFLVISVRTCCGLKYDGYENI